MIGDAAVSPVRRTPRVPVGRPRSTRRRAICLSLGTDETADVYADELRRRLAALTDLSWRFRLVTLDQTDSLINGVRSHRSSALIVRAPESRSTIDDVESVIGSGLPVVTLGSDLPTTSRAGYAGVDGLSAGRTVGQHFFAAAAPSAGQTVVVVPAEAGFRIDEELEQGFRRTCRDRRISVVDVDSLDFGGKRRPERSTTSVEDGIVGLFAVGAGAGELLETLREMGKPTPGWICLWKSDGDVTTVRFESARHIVAAPAVDAEAARALGLVRRAVDDDPRVLPPPGQVRFSGPPAR